MQLWKYTDDAAVFIILSIWGFEKIANICRGTVMPSIVEDTYMMMVLGYVFGNIVQQSKLFVRRA